MSSKWNVEWLRDRVQPLVENLNTKRGFNRDSFMLIGSNTQCNMLRNNVGTEVDKDCNICCVQCCAQFVSEP